MAARTHSADPRAERVRTLLRDAAFALAHERPVDEITVGDLVARAGVSRQVFYQHFRTATTPWRRRSARVRRGYRRHRRRPRRRILRALRVRRRHRAMYHNVVSSAVTHASWRPSARTRSPPAWRSPPGHAVVGAIAAPSPDAVSRFLVGGFQEVLRSWMEDPDADPPPRPRRAALDTVDALLGLPPLRKAPMGKHHAPRRAATQPPADAQHGAGDGRH